MTATFTEFTQTRDQRLAALERANDIRTRRSKLKKQIRAGEVSAASIVADPPAYVHTMKVHDLLLSVPKYGAAKVAKVMRRVQVAPGKTVAGISDRQRAALLEELARGVTESSRG